MKYILEDKDYLSHHGVKGQKWGVENGPPYPLNDTVKAVAYRGGKLKDGTQLNVSKRDVARARKIVDKNIKHLSTSELNEYRNRLLLENQLGDLTGSNFGKKQGQKLLDSIDRIATQSAVNIGTRLLTQGGLLGIKNILEMSNAPRDTISFLTNFNYNDKGGSEKKSNDPFGQFTADDYKAFDDNIMDLVQDVFK